MGLKNNTRIVEFVFFGLSNDPTVKIVLSVIFSTMYVVILLANSLIVLVTFMASELQTPMYFFLSNLSLVDISVSSSVVPRMIRDLLAAAPNILFAQCMAQLYICFTVGTTECLFMAVLAYDRYVAICYPLRYSTINNRAACIKIVAGTWGCGFLVAISCLAVAINLDLCGHNVIHNFLCETPEILALACGNVAAAKFVIFALCAMLHIGPTCFIAVTYTIIVRAIFKISSSAGRKKTFSTCTSHIIVVTLFFAPGMANYLKIKSEAAHNKNKYFAIFYTAITPLLNPLIYTLRNKQFNCALKKIFS